MTALDVGIAFQHLIDPDAVPTDVYAHGLAAILGLTTPQTASGTGTETESETGTPVSAPPTEPGPEPVRRR